jgi:hypothetical protein
MARGKRTFGAVRKLPRGNFQERYTAPDGSVRKAHLHTYVTGR